MATGYTRFANQIQNFHIRTVQQQLDTIKVLFIHQLIHQWVVLKNNIKIYIKMYIKTAVLM